MSSATTIHLFIVCEHHNLKLTNKGGSTEKSPNKYEIGSADISDLFIC